MRYIKPFNESKKSSSIKKKEKSESELIKYCNDKIKSNYDVENFEAIKKCILFSLEKKLNDYNIDNYTIDDDGNIIVNGDVDFSSSGLKTIPFKFYSIGGDFDISYNDLISLENSPRFVDGNFICHNNKINTLKGCPDEIGGNFNCEENSLTTLIDLTPEIGGNLNCRDNRLKSLDFISNIEGVVYCDENVKIDDIRGYCKEVDNNTDTNNDAAFQVPDAEEQIDDWYDQIAQNQRR
jgi:hypothetical protein